MPPSGNAKGLDPRGAASAALRAPLRAARGARDALARAAGRNPQAVGILLALAAPVLWSTSGLFIKVLEIEALPLTGLRCAMAGLILAPMVRNWRVRPGWDLAALAVAYTVMSLTFVTATKWTTAANAIALQSTSPAWVFMVSCLVARRVAWRYVPPIAIILGGLAVILLEPVEGAELLGNLLGLVAGIAFALVTIFYARVRRPMFEVVALVNLTAALAVFLIQPSAFRFSAYSAGDWLSLAYLGGVQLGLANLCFYGALKRISTTQAAILSLLEPILNPIWVFLAIGEVPSGYGFAGGALIISGIVVDAWVRRPAAWRKAGPPPRGD